ncbi:hypothetical protein J132_09579 [Termitomyces sp. J132]|nr:hypothetical protein J132_09579 [Termitomyces sp. J132]
MPNDIRQECVVSLESRSIEACHVLRPWIFDEDMLIRLEYAWGREYGALDFDSEANTIYLTPELRRMFESGLWALLPIDFPLLRFITNTDFTIEKPIETAYIGKDPFDYVFVPLPGMESTISRFDDRDSLPQKHVFPYTTLPVLHLHVQPHYVLIDLYEKIMKHERTVCNMWKYKGYEPYFKKYARADVTCRGTYRMWKKWIVPSDFVGNPVASQRGDAQTVSCGSSTLPVPKLRPGAYAWDVDEVGLRPTDSVTYISHREDGEDSSDDDGDEYVVDETDSAFQARMQRWIAVLQPGLMTDLEPMQAEVIEMAQLGKTEKEPGIDTGSPTMVGSISLNVDKMDRNEVNSSLEMYVRHRTKSISDKLLSSSTMA